MKALSPNLEVEKLKPTNRGVSRNRSPVRTVNSYLPAIEGTQRRIRSLRGSRGLPKIENREPFDISEVLQQVETTIDAEGRHWPKLSSPPQNRFRDLENTIEKQKTELSARCIQIADLCNIQQQQAAELQTAQDAIERLDNSVTLLQKALTQQENETVAAKEALAISEKDKATLRAQLDKMKYDSTKLLQQMLDLKTALNSRDNAITSTQERVEALEAELTVKIAEKVRWEAALEEVKQRHRNELTQQAVRFEARIKEFRAILVDRDKQIAKLEETRVKLGERCDEFTDTADMLEIKHKQTREKLKSQIELIKLLDVRLRVERENAEVKIAELTAELQRERLEHSNAERISAVLRKDIALLLPKLTALRSEPNMPDVGTSMSGNDAVDLLPLNSLDFR